MREARMWRHRMQRPTLGGPTWYALEEAVRLVVSWLKAGTPSYVHCRAGWQRSAAVAAGAIAVYEGIGIDEAVALVQERKPSADPLPHQRDDLRAWWNARSHL